MNNRGEVLVALFMNACGDLQSFAMACDDFRRFVVVATEYFEEMRKNAKICDELVFPSSLL